MRFDLKPVSARPSALAETAWYEFAIRFVFGGLITAAAGIIAKKYGPITGGLFLAFPAIFPSGATLIEKRERERKARAGLTGVCRARLAVAADAAGAAMGCVGLIAFATAVWRWLNEFPAPLVIAGATLAWAMTSGMIWIALKHHWVRH